MKIQRLLRLVLLVFLFSNFIFAAERAPDAPSMPPPLNELNSADRNQKILDDLKSLEIYRQGLFQTLEFMRSRPDLFPANKLESERMLDQQARQEVWDTWQNFLDYYLALDSLAQYHRHFDLLKLSPLSDSFLVSYGAFLVEYRSAIEFLTLTENDRSFNKWLNERMPELGLPANTYADFKYRFLNVALGTEFAAMEAVYHGFKDDRHPQVRQAIAEDAQFLWRFSKGKGQLMTVKNGLHIIKSKGFEAYFPVQMGVAEAMGDAKVYRWGQELISPEQVQTMQPLLQPGDVLLERREWHLSNMGLPGFWTHAALYIGTPEERQAYFDDPEVKAWLAAQGQADGDFNALLKNRYASAWGLCSTPQEEGRPPRVLEAISEGVVFTTLEHSAGADSVAVLRPRLGKKEKALALERAFQYSGRPYDYNFDFLTDNELVCTELVYKSYEPCTESRGVKWELTKLAGRTVVPANELARQFDALCGTDKQQLDFVTFLDGREWEKQALIGDLEAFRKTWQRPKWHKVGQIPMGAAKTN